MSWEIIPEEILLQILFYLKHDEICRVGSICKRWLLISKDEILWRRVLRRDFKLRHLNISHTDVQCWRREYQRMVDQCPRVCETVLDQHTDEVLFVSFSRCGQLFVTCSKDGFFIIWKITRFILGNIFLIISTIKYFRSGTAEARHIQDMKVHGWIYTWAAKFNKSSTKLLVAGVFDEVDGGVAVFDVSGDVPR